MFSIHRFTKFDLGTYKIHYEKRFKCCSTVSFQTHWWTWSCCGLKTFISYINIKMKRKKKLGNWISNKPHSDWHHFKANWTTGFCLSSFETIFNPLQDVSMVMIVYKNQVYKLLKQPRYNVASVIDALHCTMYIPSHVLPRYPGWHVQLNAFNPSLHIPPFLQGAETQSSISEKGNPMKLSATQHQIVLCFIIHSSNKMKSSGVHWKNTWRETVSLNWILSFLYLPDRTQCKLWLKFEF